ncbi:hypothetical protein D3C85_881990 [compost metagenome]
MGLHPGKIFRRVDTGGRGRVRDMHGDGNTVPQHAQLFERLDRFQRRRGQLRIFLQECIAVCIQADMAQRHIAGRYRVFRLREAVAVPRNCRAREIQGAAILVQHDLDHVRVERIGHIVQRMGARGHGDGGADLRRAGGQQGRIDQRFVALQVDDDGIERQLERARHFGDAVRARRMVAARHAHFHAMRGAGGADGFVVGGDDDAHGARQGCLLGHAHHHGFAAQVSQRLARQARRGQAGRDDDDERHRYSTASCRVRASSAHMMGMPSRIG